MTNTRGNLVPAGLRRDKKGNGRVDLGDLHVNPFSIPSKSNSYQKPKNQADTHRVSSSNLAQTLKLNLVFDTYKQTPT
jgi:hypothetical protein